MQQRFDRYADGDAAGVFPLIDHRGRVLAARVGQPDPGAFADGLEPVGALHAVDFRVHILAEGHPAHEAGVGAEGVGEADAEQLLEEGGVVRRVGGDVGAADEQAGSGGRLAAQGVLESFRPDGEALRHRAATDARAPLLAADEVDHVGRDLVRREGVAGHRIEGIAEAHQEHAVAVGVVEGVAREDEAGLIVIGRAVAGVFVVHELRGAAELVVLADVADFLHVGHARVHPALEAGVAGALHPRRGGDAVEVVDNQHGGAPAADGRPDREDLGGEAPAAGVEGFDLVAVDVAGLDVERQHGLRALDAGVPAAAVDAGIDEVAFGPRRGLLGVGRGLPLQARVAAVLQPDREGPRRQGLHHVGGMV